MYVCVYVSGQTTCMATLPLLSLGHNVKHNKRMPQEKSVCQATDKYSHTAAHVHTHNSSNVKMESTCAYKPTPTLPPPHPQASLACLCRRQLIHFACYF